MNIYQITSKHCSPKDCHESMLGFVLAENDEQVYNFLKTEPKINGFSTFSCWEYHEDEEDEEQYIEDFKAKVLEAKTDDIEDLAYRYNNAYYGTLFLGWKLWKENVAIDQSIIDLGLITKI